MHYNEMIYIYLRINSRKDYDKYVFNTLQEENIYKKKNITFF